MNETLKKIDKFKRDELKKLLSQCTVKQQQFFLRLYPGGIDKMGDNMIRWSIIQCAATIKRNKKKEVNK